MERINRITHYFIWLSSAHPVATLNVICALAFIGGMAFTVAFMWALYHLLIIFFANSLIAKAIMGALFVMGVGWCLSEEKVKDGKKQLKR